MSDSHTGILVHPSFGIRVTEDRYPIVSGADYSEWFRKLDERIQDLAAEEFWRSITSWCVSNHASLIRARPNYPEDLALCSSAGLNPLSRDATPDFVGEWSIPTFLRLGASNCVEIEVLNNKGVIFGSYENRDSMVLFFEPVP